VRLLVRLVETALIAYAVVVAGLFLLQRQLLYLPDRSRPELGALAQLGVRAVTLTTADGLRLLAWYLPPPPGRPFILYLHGNGGNIGWRSGRLARFAQLGWGVLFLEYRGYGGNPGSPDETGLYQDGRAAADFLSHQGIAASRLVLWGESLGAAVAVQLAGERKVAAVVLEAPFTSLPDIAQYHFPFAPAAWLVRDRYDTLAKIGRIGAPLLILHGGDDRIVPLRFGQKLLAAAREPKQGWFPPAGGHNDLGRYGAIDVAAKFLRRLD
jgi:uncharacterized protein